ncbi:glycosyltransferase involved in cell wall biosynthesis [Flavobacterium sp. W4I14]|nr:glycosyltransferase involved in cell wall biosynthesis [Flavobacterium sp. W4I14]
MIKADIPLVSIALCTYNGEKYLAKQLDSIFTQTYPNLEVIVVDDCSTDNTLNILSAYQKLNSNLQLILNDQNLGFNQNFKKALSLCTADYIAIADQDDIWLNDKISQSIQHIGDNVMLYHDSEYIDENGQSLRKSTSSHHRFVSGKCAQNLIYYNCISGHACLIKRDLLKLTPPFDHSLYYDWWLAYTAACTGKINFITDKLVKHRKHDESSTKNDKTDPKSLRIKHLNLFRSHSLTPESLAKLIDELLTGYKELQHKNFSIKLFRTLLIHAKGLFFIRKRSFYSHFKMILKESSRS